MVMKHGGARHSARARTLSYTELLVQALGGVTDERLALYDTLKADLTTAGVWSKLAGLWIRAAHSAQASRVNLIAPGVFTMVDTGGTFTIDQGWAGDGVAASSSTAYNPTAAGAALNDFYFGVWYLSGADTNNQDGAAGTVYLTPKNVSGNIATRINDGTALTTANPGGLPGYYSMSRSASNAYRLSKDGVNLASKTTVSTSRPNIAVTLGQWSGSGTFNAREHSAIAIGAHLTDQEDADLFAALTDYLTAVGAVA